MVGKVIRIFIPDRQNIEGDFPTGVLKQSKHSQESQDVQDFIDAVMSAEGQAMLNKYGFIPEAT